MIEYRDSGGNIVTVTLDDGAVLVTPQDFENRFLDYKIKEDKMRLLDGLRALKRKKKESVESIELLRQLRGYNG